MEPAAIFDELQWFDDEEPRGAAMNMAIDETLLAGLSRSEDPRPLLRAYRWDQPSVSIGYFDNVAAARKSFPGVPLVRRWTGGGIVEHGRDLTYSLLVPRRRVAATWQGTGAYRAIHLAIATALRAGGLEGAALAGGPLVAGGETSRECFRRPVDCDVMLAGKKVAGGAQRRTRLGLLHQGSIQFLPALLAPGGTLHRAIRAGLPAAFARKWEKRLLSATEFSEASRLSANRYGTVEWTEKF